VLIASSTHVFLGIVILFGQHTNEVAIVVHHKYESVKHKGTYALLYEFVFGLSVQVSRMSMELMRWYNTYIIIMTVAQVYRYSLLDI